MGKVDKRVTNEERQSKVFLNGFIGKNHLLKAKVDWLGLGVQKAMKVCNNLCGTERGSS
jgi:hypothetical protein